MVSKRNKTRSTAHTGSIMGRSGMDGSRRGDPLSPPRRSLLDAPHRGMIDPARVKVHTPAKRPQINIIVDPDADETILIGQDAEDAVARASQRESLDRAQERALQEVKHLGAFTPPTTPAELLNWRERFFQFWASNIGKEFLVGWIKAGYGQSIDGSPIDIDRTQDAITLAIAAAAPFLMSPEMGDLLNMAAKSLPEGAQVRHDEFHSPFGLIVFEKPNRIFPADSFDPTDAVLWMADPTNKIHPERITVITFASMGDLEADAHGLAESFLYHNRIPLLDAIFSIDSGDPWNQGTFDPQFYRYDRARPTDGYRPAWRWITTLNHFLRQKLAVVERRHVSERQQRKAFERQGIEPSVNAITLRKREAVAPSGNHREVEWSCQWPVSGHWREQPYPSRNATERIWIHGYVKGPQDKPLRVRDRAFVVAR